MRNRAEGLKMAKIQSVEIENFARSAKAHFTRFTVLRAALPAFVSI